MKYEEAMSLVARAKQRLEEYATENLATIQRGGTARLESGGVLEADERGTLLRARSVAPSQFVKVRVGPRKTPNVGLGVSAGATEREWKFGVRAWQDSEIDAFVRVFKELKSVLPRDADIEVTGRIQAGGVLQSSAPCMKKRPLRVGSCISHERLTSGTLGAFVHDTQAGSGEILILSCRHVISDESDRRRILQPGRAHGGTLRDHFGDLKRWALLRRTGNVADAAVATITDKKAMPDDLKIPNLGELTGMWRLADMEHLLGIEVVKVGSRTKVTRGRVSWVGPYAMAYDDRDRWFNQLIEVKGKRGPFSEGGDSGALVVDTKGRAVGLLIGGNENGQSYLSPIESTLAALKVRLAC